MSVHIYGSGGGGILSSDVTATKAQVLSGYQTLTSDSSDEVAAGTMKNINQSATISFASNNQTKVVPCSTCTFKLNSDNATRLNVKYDGESGYITSNTLFGVPAATLRTAIGYTNSALVLNDTTIAGLTGTMVNRGSPSITLGLGKSYTIPAGYYEGGTISCATNYSQKNAFTYTPNKPTANATILAANTYMNGNITVAGDQDLIASNIKKGVKIFNITGTAVSYESGTKTWA